GKGGKDEAPAVTVQAAGGEKREISRMGSAEAGVFSIAQSVITTKINAPGKKVLGKPGQKVPPGQLLAILEKTHTSGAAMDSQGAFDQAQATYKTSVNQTLPEETQKAELDVQTAQQELDTQQKLYSSREDLFKQGALPRKDLDQSAVALAQAKSQYNV